METNLTVRTHVTDGIRPVAKWAAMCADKILYIDPESTPEPIREQAFAFKNKIWKAIQNYMNMLLKERTIHIANLAEQQGHKDFAALLRKME